jgi:hypothetical protein
LGKKVPAKLVLAAVDKGVLTIQQAAQFADLKGPSQESVELLSGLALANREISARSELLVSALAAAKAIRSDQSRAQALATVAPISRRGSTMKL